MSKEIEGKIVRFVERAGEVVFQSTLTDTVNAIYAGIMIMIALAAPFACLVTLATLIDGAFNG